MSVIHLYLLPQVITLTTGAGAPNMNYPVNSTKIRLFQHVRNDVDVYIKNIDRKPVSLGDEIATIHILDMDNSRSLLLRDLTVVNENKGWYRFTIAGPELAEWS